MELNQKVLDQMRSDLESCKRCVEMPSASQVLTLMSHMEALLDFAGPALELVVHTGLGPFMLKVPYIPKTYPMPHGNNSHVTDLPTG
jgi:hypothetical protein